MACPVKWKDVIGSWKKNIVNIPFWFKGIIINWASEAHNPHTVESTCNEYMKQY